MAKDSKEKGGWNYRVVIEREPDLVNPSEFVESYSFRDVYYGDDGEINGWGSDPQHPIGETLQDLLSDIKLMSEALERPVLLLERGEITDQIRLTQPEIKAISKVFAPSVPTQSNRELKDELKQKAYGMHEYEIEQKKRELEHEIDKAKYMGDTKGATRMMEAYQKFQRDIQNQQIEMQKRGIKPDMFRNPFSYVNKGIAGSAGTTGGGGGGGGGAGTWHTTSGTTGGKIKPGDIIRGQDFSV